MNSVQLKFVGSLLLAGLAVSTAIAAPNNEDLPRRRANNPTYNTPATNDTTSLDEGRYGRSHRSDAPYADQNPSGFYLGISPGLGLVDGREDTPSSYKKESFGAKLFMGVQFTPMWNLEWGYINFGKGSADHVSYAQKSHGLYLAGVTAFGLGSSNFDLLIRYGLSYVENREESNSFYYDNDNDKEKKTGGLLGFGGRYRFGPTYSLGFDIDVGADTSAMISVSNRWQF